MAYYKEDTSRKNFQGLLRNFSSLRTTLCVRFKSEVVACGVVYAAARRFQVPFPENPPWWKVFDAEKHEIDEVCKVLANLYRQPKARYIEVCKESESNILTNKTLDPSPDAKEIFPKNSTNAVKTSSQYELSNPESSGGKDAIVKVALDKPKGSKKSENEIRDALVNGELRDDSTIGKSKQQSHRALADDPGDRSKERDKERSRARDRERDREKDKERDRGRGREWERDRERERDKELEREREKGRDKARRSDERSKDTGHSEKSRHHLSSRDRDYQSSSRTSSRDKERH